MSASADVLAMAKVEVDLNAIPEGKNVCHTTLDD
jgi:ubiquinol-cytochrome c reductase iron-sulfur subunit